MRPLSPVVLTALATGCGPRVPPTAHPAGAESPFEELSSRFLEDFLRVNPVAATGLGDHRYDHLWPDIDAPALQRQAEWLRAVQAQVAALPVQDLPLEQQVDAAILAHQLAWEEFTLREERPWSTDPLTAVTTVGVGLDSLVSRDFAPIEQRMVSLQGRLEGLPAFLEAARVHLERPPRVHTETAIAQNAALLAWVEGPLREEFPEGHAAALDAAADQAGLALRDFQGFLERDLLPRSDADFRLGAARFEQKLRFSLDTDMDSRAVLDAAWALLDETSARMAEDAAALYPELFPGQAPPADPHERIRRVLDRLAEEHPDDDSIIAEAQRDLEEATRFVGEHDLVSLPDEAVRVIVMPEFRRGVAIAYCDAPGPLEAQRETFYAIAPPPAAWPEARRASFYREYNSAMLQELTLHEAMPGHFLQMAHAARFDSPVRSVFSSGTFTEGWALYAEWAMAEAGYGGPRVRLQREKMVLRLCLNAILDQGIHAGSLEHDEAIALMRERGFQEEGEAEGKWTRACLTSAQLSTYLVGLLEVMALRRDYEAAQGSSFEARVFHDALLSHGTPPPRHVRRLLGI